MKRTEDKIVTSVYQLEAYLDVLKDQFSEITQNFTLDPAYYSFIYERIAQIRSDSSYSADINAPTVKTNTALYDEILVAAAKEKKSMRDAFLDFLTKAHASTGADTNRFGDMSLDEIFGITLISLGFSEDTSTPLHEKLIADLEKPTFVYSEVFRKHAFDYMRDFCEDKGFDLNQMFQVDFIPDLEGGLRVGLPIMVLLTGRIHFFENLIMFGAAIDGTVPLFSLSALLFPDGKHVDTRSEVRDKYLHVRSPDGAIQLVKNSPHFLRDHFLLRGGKKLAPHNFALRWMTVLPIISPMSLHVADNMVKNGCVPILPQNNVQLSSSMLVPFAKLLLKYGVIPYHEQKAVNKTMCNAVLNCLRSMLDNKYGTYLKSDSLALSILICYLDTTDYVQISTADSSRAYLLYKKCDLVEYDYALESCRQLIADFSSKLPTSSSASAEDSTFSTAELAALQEQKNLVMRYKPKFDSDEQAELEKDCDAAKGAAYDPIKLLRTAMQIFYDVETGYDCGLFEHGFAVVRGELGVSPDSAYFLTVAMEPELEAAASRPKSSSSLQESLKKG